LGFGIDEVDLVVEDNNVVEKNNIFGIEHIEDFYHKIFSNLVPRMDFKVVEARVAKASVQSSYSMVVHMIEY